MVDLTLAWQVDEACLNALPPLREMVFDGWLLRLSGGPIRRANSVNPLGTALRDSQRIIAVSQKLYRTHGQSSIFRVPTIAGGIDKPLERLGFVAEGETSTLLADLADDASIVTSEVDLVSDPSVEWLEAKLRIGPVSDASHRIFVAIISNILLPKALAASRHEGRIASVARGVIHDDLLVVDSVATDPALRQKGLGTRIVGKLMKWARHEGAKAACLPVVADNAPARALYRKLGFRTELYRYHYWREPTQENS